MEDEINLENIIAQGALLIDVRTVDEYKNGHVSGSLNVPLSDIEDAMTWLIKDVPIIVVCESGFLGYRRLCFLRWCCRRGIWLGEHGRYGPAKLGCCLL